jgi:excisionase family DNA binding protein
MQRMNSPDLNTSVAPILVDSREAARLLAISERTLWDLTFQREIPSLKIGRCVRYRVADLHEWAEKKTRPAEPSPATAGRAASLS